MNESNKIFIYKTKDVLGIREFLARVESNGSLVFDGWDLNKESKMGIKEYEWTWTILKNDVSKVYEALGIEDRCDDKDKLLGAIEERFVGKDSDSLLVRAFLDENKIPYKSWVWRS